MTHRAFAMPPAREGGVVIFIALIVMVALSLAGIALVHSVDTTTAVVGNLAFRQAALLPGNLAVEQANAALFPDAAPSGNARITDKTNDLASENYYASFQRDANGNIPPIPTTLQTAKAAYDLARVVYPDANKDFQVRYVIERACNNPGPASPGNCDMMPPKQGLGGTQHDPNAPALPQIPFYRVTVRVDGPKNTTAFLQAMLR